MSPDKIERTDLAQGEFETWAPSDEEWENAGFSMGKYDDGEPLACGVENPEVCESCT